MCTLDGLLQEVGNHAELSFYGVDKKLAQVDEFLTNAIAAQFSKAPAPEQKELVERKDEILQAQNQLRRAMAQRLEQPQLMKREKPLAEAFLEGEIKKVQASAAGNEKAAKALERLKDMLSLVRSTAPVPDSRQVKEAEAQIVQFEKDWKELAPIHAKWEAGRHSFKSNDDLQTFKRRYEVCRKGRDDAGPRLERALCRFVNLADARSLEREEAKAEKYKREGWAGVAAKKAAAPSAKRPAPPKKPVGPAKWESAEVTLAQRLRAEAAAQVRAGAQDNEGDEEEDEEQDEELRSTAAPKVPLAVPKQPPVLPPGADRPPPPPPPKSAPALKPGRGAQIPSPGAKARNVDDAEDDEEEEEALPTQATVSAKRKGKQPKKKNAPARDQGAEPKESSSSRRTGPSIAGAILAAADAAVQGSLLQALMRPSCWSPPADDAVAIERLAEISAALPWANPMGLVLPLDWRDFAELAVDLGPARTSKRGKTPWFERLQTNVPNFFAHYVTIVFFFMQLHALSHFGLFLWVLALQSALILMPPDVPHLPRPARVFALQGAHLLLWLVFVRSVWVMHFWIKALVVAAIFGHACVVVPIV